MGSFCTSGPQTTTSNQSQTYTPNGATLGAGTNALTMAQSAASQPFQAPAAPVAPFNPFQQQAFSQYQGIQGGTNPYFQNASANMNTAQTPVTQADVASFENPYADQDLANLKKYVFDPQRTQTMGSATQAAGGVGADRLALTSQNLDKTQSDALSQAQAGFYGQALTAAQQSKQQALQSAQGWANLGVGQQGAQLQATGALAGAGSQQQAQSQAELMSPYEQTLARIAYPYQQSQFLAGITGGLSGALGGTTQGNGTQSVYQPTPSMFNMLAGGAGMGLAAYGAFGGFGGSPSYGGGSAVGGDAYGGSSANPLPGLSAADYGYGYASGGEVQENPLDLIPNIPLQNTSGQAHNNLNLTPSNSGGGGSGSSGAGDAMKMASQLLPLLMMQEGGSVNPWDMGRGYAPGGDVEEVDPDDYNRIDDKLARPLEREAPNLGMWPFNRGMADAQGNVTMFPDSPPTAPRSDPAGRVGRWLGLPNLGQSEAGSSGVTPAAAADMPPQGRPNPWTVPPNAGTMPMPGAYTRPPPPMIPSPAPQPTSVAQIPQSPDRTGGYGPRPHGINTDMKIGDFEMPRGQQPYPDSLDRDAGQNFTRSPWMALLQAGAKMAQSTKSGLGGLGEGVEAGTKTLENQRKELRSEQQINQKAEELYRHAKTELDKYTRKTPHELATEHHQEQSLAQGRFQPINYTDPATGQIRVGNYDAKRGVLVDSMTRQPVTEGVRLLGRNAGLPMTEAQIESAAKNRFVNEPGKYGSIDEAREAVKKQIQAAQSPPGTQPEASAESAIPDPGDGNRVSGTLYINPQTGKPDRWR